MKDPIDRLEQYYAGLRREVQVPDVSKPPFLRGLFVVAPLLAGAAAVYLASWFATRPAPADQSIRVMAPAEYQLAKEFAAESPSQPPIPTKPPRHASLDAGRTWI
jgi:hypothetical protein